MNDQLKQQYVDKKDWKLIMFWGERVFLFLFWRVSELVATHFKIQSLPNHYLTRKYQTFGRLHNK